MPAPTFVPGTVVPRLETIHEGWALEATRGPVPSGIAGRSVPATVPGCTHTDLQAAGLIPDPYLGTNEATGGTRRRSSPPRPPTASASTSSCRGSTPSRR
jgi:beta-mannosidase